MPEIANNVQENTSTTGTGTVTLTGATGNRYVRFRDQFQNGDLVYYSIFNGDNSEHGVGTFNSVGGTDTLTRATTISGVVSGSTVDTPITLSGNSIVTVADSAEALQGAAGLGIGAGIGGTGLQSDNYAGGGFSATTANRRLYIAPVFYVSPRIITQIGTEVQTADAADPNTRIGLYSVGSDGNPDTVLLDSGDIDISTTGPKFNSAASWVVGTNNFLLPAGAYYAALLCESATAIFNGTERTRNAAGHGGSDAFSARTGSMRTYPGITGNLPNNPGAGNSDFTNQPLLRTK